MGEGSEVASDHRGRVGDALDGRPSGRTTDGVEDVQRVRQGGPDAIFHWADL